MVTPTKSNILQRMLQRHQQKVEKSQAESETSPQKSNWMRKLNIISPSKVRAPPTSPIGAVSPGTMNIQRQDLAGVNGIMPSNLRRQPPILALNESSELLDAEESMHELNVTYLSPKKEDSSMTNKKKFVKKMISLFEKKTVPTYRDPKQYIENFDRRRSVPDIYRNCPADSVIPMDNTYVVERESKSLDNSFDNCLDYTNVSSSHETLAEKSSDSSVQFAEEILNASTASSFEVPPARSDLSLKRERAPQIIGAFLKTPIEVDNTTIDWLPIPSAKLPRKKSFTKFFSLLSAKKVWDNTNKNSLSRKDSSKGLREHRDSGYDGKSNSPGSSLESTTSFPNATSNERQNTQSITEPVTRVSTFMSNNQQETDVPKEDFYSDNNNINDNTKLTFEEIPRSEVRLSLGPFFPIQPKLFVKSLNTEGTIMENNEEIRTESTCSSTNEYQSHTPSLSPLPKHPFISEGKLDSPFMPFDDDELNQVELRRATKWKSPSFDADYDVPRYISTSGSTSYINAVNNRHSYDSIYQNMVINDVPRISIPARPKSSVYEECQSLKRRTAGVDSLLTASREGFYASPTARRSQFATIKPKKSMLTRNREYLSMERFKTLHTITVQNLLDYTDVYSDITRS